MDQDPIVIGRRGDLALQDDWIDDQHVEIVRHEGQFVVIDLNSVTGSWVNGERLRGPRVLADGDLIYIGQNGAVPISFELANRTLLERHVRRDAALDEAMNAADPERIAKLLSAPECDDVLVFADTCASRGDPRGEHIVLCHRLHQAQGAKERHTVSRAIGKLLTEHGPRLFGRPTGFPFRTLEHRAFVEYRGTRRSRLRGRGGRPMVRRLKAFFETLTNCSGPDVVAIAAWDADADRWRAQLGPPPRAVPADLSPGITHCWKPDVVPSFSAIDALLSKGQCAHLFLQFTFAFADDRWPLPFSESGHYARPERPRGTSDSVIWINVGEEDPGRAAVRLFFPFESQADDRFVALWAECKQHIGSLLSAKNHLRDARELP